MQGKPTLLFYCQHSLGMGHLVRSFALAGACAEQFRVVLMNGGRLPEGITQPEGVEIRDLPPLGADENWGLVSLDARYDLAQARALRRQMLLDALTELRPQAIIIELYPFGRKKFREELEPLLEAARTQSRPQPLVVCSLRDILTARGDQQVHDDRAARVCNRDFDAILVHASSWFARLEESFRPTEPLRIPVHYTGFVAPADGCCLAEPRERRGIVVSAGGGIVGAPLFRAAIDAHRLLWDEQHVPMTIVAGPFLPEADWLALRKQAGTQSGLTLIRSVRNLAAMLAGARASVSQCGYNTAIDLLRAQVPASVVPYAEGGESEQRERARRLAERGVLRVLDNEVLSGEALAAELLALLAFEPAPAGLDLQGARTSARLLADMVAERGLSRNSASMGVG